jgi:predicted RNA-binding Zn ribbon-like protein
MSRQPAIFVADAVALDFLNSVATPVDTPVDWIADGAGLLAWLGEAGLVAASELERLGAQAMPGELDAVASQARHLRDWFRAFVQDHRGQPLSADTLRDLEPLNRLLERDESFRQVAHDHHGDTPLTLRSVRRWRSPEALLQPIGEVMARFVCEEGFEHVKACEGPTCTLMFADHTRGRKRRWCSMALCGNRAKQAAYRNRARAEA